MLAEVDSAWSLWTRDVLGERHGFCARRGSVVATLDLGPQIEEPRIAALDSGPDGLRF
jgi:hypothetical protein